MGAVSALVLHLRHYFGYQPQGSSLSVSASVGTLWQEESTLFDGHIFVVLFHSCTLVLLVLSFYLLLMLLEQNIGIAQEDEPKNGLPILVGCPYLLAAKCAPARSMSAECHRLSFRVLSSISVIPLEFNDGGIIKRASK